MRHPGEIMMLATVVIGVVAVLGYFLGIYNSLIALKNLIARSWANIDVLLKQRHDELPKLVSVCEGYMQHERQVFDKLSEARGALVRARGVSERAQAESQLTSALGQFFAVAEAYPDLKANVGFLQLQSRISDLENQIADRREYYNDTVTTFNTRIQQIPDMWVAQWQGMQAAELFKVDEADRRDVEIKFAIAS
jgi:LemA protein